MAFGRVRDAKAIEPLVEIVDDELPLVRTQVACLGETGDMKEMPSLTKAAKDDSHSVGEAAKKPWRRSSIVHHPE